MHTQKLGLRTLPKTVLAASVLVLFCAGYPGEMFGQTAPRLTRVSASQLTGGAVQAAPLY